MSKPKRGLGKGLDALIGKAQPAPQQNAQTAAPDQAGVSTTANGEQLKDIPIEKIMRGQYQPRQNFDQAAIEELAESIKSQGLLQPIVVRPQGSQYEIIAGERRWRACQLAGLQTITAIIKALDDETTMAMAIIENLQREDLNPVEEAMGLQRLQQEFGLSQQEVADAVGKPRSTVANILRLTNLHADALILLERGDIETGHAKCLLPLDKNQQAQIARQIADKELTVRQTEALIKQLDQPAVTKTNTTTVDPNIRRLEQQLAETLGAKVLLQQSSKKKGKLVIHYNNLDELDGILKHIK